MSSIIASHTVPGTPISITILHRPEQNARFPYIILRETNGATFSCGPSRLSNTVTTEVEAREYANESWAHYIKCRDDARRAQSVEVPAGRYAIEFSDGIKFYVVDRPTEGRWAGYTFVKVQASDELYPVRNPKQREGILLEIAVDPQAAMLRYGREIGKCGHCNRTLTNAESRALGIGPVCRGRMGW
jgi:hypothetical protein